MKNKYMGMILLTLVIAGIVGFLNFHPVFGGKTNGIMKSKNYKNGKFHNLEDVTVESREESMSSMMYEFFFGGSPQRVPKKALPTLEFDKEKLKENSFAWLGHSTVLMNVDGKNIITDPVFYKASPLFIGGKPFRYTHALKIKDLPNIDVVVISHDHYDHLDYKSIQEIDSKVGKFLVPLGVKSHLSQWGVDENKVEELDWYDSITIDEVTYTLTPAQHFSGRGLSNRNTTLWGSWVLKGKTNNIYFSGDTGYFEEFKNIGEKYGPFDIAFLENGAYNKNWKDIHMFPEQSIQAGIDLQAKVLMPIHWGKFDLSLHSWYDPIERFSELAQEKNLGITYPLVGDIFSLDNLPTNNWWKNLIEK